jgi:hypothetical protein
VVPEKDGEDQLNMSVKNEVLHRVRLERNILHTIKRTAIQIGHILHRNCLLKHVTEKKMTGRQGRSVGIHPGGI